MADGAIPGLEAFGEKLMDRRWRLENLYWINDKTLGRIRFIPKPEQTELFETLQHRNVDLKGRQLGVTTGYCILWLDACLFNKDLRVGIVAHTKEAAKIIFRDKVKYAYDNLPDEIRSQIPADKCDANEILLRNGSGIRVAVSFVSGTVQILQVTELGYTCAHHPDRAQEINTGSFEAVPTDGIIVVESTAEGGAGLFFDLCEGARKGENGWRFKFLPWWKEPSYTLQVETPIEYVHERLHLDKVEHEIGRTFTQGQRQWWCAKLRRLGESVYSQYPSTPDEAFRASTKGAYYGSQMLQAWQEGRVTKVPVDRAMRVDTWWDLGMNDEMFIWFIQRNGYEIRAVHCYKNSGEGLPHYAAYLEQWRKDNQIVYGRHVAPHDIKVRELNTGKTRLETAGGLGIHFEVAPMLPVVDGIEAVRAALPRCVFDQEGCESGIKGLEQYRKEWNEKLGVYRDQPLHDFASHPADAFRTGIICPGHIITGGSQSRIPARPVARESWR